MAKAQKSEHEDGELETEDRPVLDLNDSKVKKFIKQAKAKGYVTHDELNNVLPSDELTSDQIEDTMSALSEMGIQVVENEDEVDNASGSKSTAVTKTGSGAVAKKGNARGTDRTDDPVRMYLREMGAVELLSREGEIAIAKRIEAGRNTMIARCGGWSRGWAVPARACRVRAASTSPPPRRSWPCSVWRRTPKTCAPGWTAR
mgnify:CR=1 FL=1